MKVSSPRARHSGASVTDGSAASNDRPSEGLRELTTGAAGFRVRAKSLILGAASARLLLSAPTTWWESSAHRGVSTLLFDAAWVIGLTGLPSLMGWRPAAAWRGATITAAVGLGGGALVLALGGQDAVAVRADLALRLVRLAAESVTAVSVMALAGPWLVLKTAGTPRPGTRSPRPSSPR